jgi:acyl-CoA synthetase (AMP-forming)/AMP-acid ligase II
VTERIPFTLWELLAGNLPERADRPALVLGDRSMRYGELAAESVRLARWLEEAGVGRGDRVLLHLPRSVEEVIATFACSYVGAVFVNVNWQLKPRQLDHIRSDSGARILITEAARAERLAAAGLLGEVDRVLTTGAGPEGSGFDAWDDLPQGPGRREPGEGGPIGADLAALLYTSGSTGHPKGVMVTHDNLVAGAASVARYLGNTQEDRVLGLLPMSFDYGLSQVTTMGLVGGCVVLEPVPFPVAIVATIQEHGVTGVAGVPTIWTEMVHYLQEAGPAGALPTLRYVTNSGGKIPDPVLRAMPEVLPGTDVFLMYGLTEAFRSTYLPPSLFATKRGSMGRAIPNVEVFVVGEHGICSPGEEGELVHRGALISRGYWGDPELTAARIRVNEHLIPLIGDEKVLHSGDRVRIDEDGFLWFVGRGDHLIKSRGVRISPTEVEDVAYESGMVAEAVAFGVPDERLGEVVHLAVSLRGGADVDRLQRYCRASMPSYMTPAHIWRWDGAMPRTSTGKLDRNGVVGALLSGAGADLEASAPPRQTTSERP